MKTPVCNACLETGSLCSGCVARKESGELSESDERLAKLLHSLKTKYPLDEAGFSKTIESPKLLVVFSETPSVLIGRGGRVSRAVSKELGKKVKVVDENASEKTQLEDILLPVKLQGVNEVFKDGIVVKKARVFKSQRDKLPADEETLGLLVKHVLGSEAILEFE